MAGFIKKKKEHIGLSPYALVFRGNRKIEKVQLKVMFFDMEEVHEKKLLTLEELSSCKMKDMLCWLNIDGLDNVALMEKIARDFDLENNILSDVMNPSIRPKVQEFSNGIFATIKMLHFNEAEGKIKVENLSILIFKNLLISFQEQSGEVFDPIRERIRKHKNKIRKSGSDYLAFALLDVVVDNYIYIIGQIGDRIEDLEEDMTSNPRKELLDEVNAYKQELNFLRKYIKPAKELIMNLNKMESDLLQDVNRVHFRELQDNVNEASDLSDSYREMLYDLLNIYHTSMSTKLNEIMRVLTVISVIFIPITFLVGVYGTNFEQIPELHWKYGYAFMWVFMLLIVSGMIWFFRKKKWF
jgi:magnesium transporter